MNEILLITRKYELKWENSLSSKEIHNIQGKYPEILLVNI